MAKKKKEPRIALRPFRNLTDLSGYTHQPDDLDDIYVMDVSMFRAEIMDKGSLWMCCYLDDIDERVTFWIRAKRGRIVITCTENPSNATYEPQPEQLP